MIGMAGAAFRAKGDDHRGLNGSHHFLELGAQSGQVREGRKPTVLETEEVESRTETFCRTFCLELAGGGQRSTGWNAGMVAHTFRAIGGDDQVHLASFPGQARQERADNALIVGMGEGREQGTTGLTKRCRGERHCARDKQYGGGSVEK